MTFILDIYIYIVGSRETEDKTMQTKDKNKREEIKTKGAHLDGFVKESSEQTW